MLTCADYTHNCVAVLKREMNTKLNLLALSLVVLVLSVQSKAIGNKTECYTDNNTIKQKVQKFYCIATTMYDKLQMVRQSAHV